MKGDRIIEQISIIRILINVIYKLFNMHLNQPDGMQPEKQYYNILHRYVHYKYAVITTECILI